MGSADGAFALGPLQRRVAKIFMTLRKPVYRYVLGVLGSESEAEDVMQEAFLSLYAELLKGRHVEDPKPWVFRVAHNLAIDRKRKAARTRQLEPEAWWEFEEPAQGPDSRVQEKILKEQQRARLRKAISELAPRQRRCLELRAEGLTYREIAATLSIGVSSVQNHLARGIDRIQKGFSAR